MDILLNGIKHGLRMPNEVFFHWNLEFLWLGQANWANKFWGTWGIFGRTITTHFGTVSPWFMFLIIQPIFLKKKAFISTPQICMYLRLELEFGSQRIRDLAYLCPLSVEWNNGQEILKQQQTKFWSLACQQSPNVSTTPITVMGCWQCLPLSVVQLKGKHCRNPYCCNGVVGTFEQYVLRHFDKSKESAIFRSFYDDF